MIHVNIEYSKCGYLGNYSEIFPFVYVDEKDVMEKASNMHANTNDLACLVDPDSEESECFPSYFPHKL